MYDSAASASWQTCLAVDPDSWVRPTAALAEFKGEIYRYLWIQGGSIVVILSSLYMLAESW